MSIPPNPFARGYRHLHAARLLCISHEDGSPLVWRSIHPSQAHLPDDAFLQARCGVASDFAMITTPPHVNDDLAAQCTGEGIVLNVVHAIQGEDLDGHPVHVGDVYSEGDAREVVQRLEFETGFYSRAWEVSSAHIGLEAGNYLAELADLATPSRFLFIAFRVPYSPAIGIKLIATPWTDAHLLDVEGITAEQLRQEHRDRGMPDVLADALHLAGQADVRILIFDADAPMLDGLPLVDEES